MVRLETKRLVLREIKDSDLNDLVHNINNKNITRFLYRVPYPYSKKDGKDFISKCKKYAKKNKREDYPLVIALKQEDKLIGSISLEDVNRFQGDATIGYWLGEKYWMNGYMAEAFREILDFAFSKLKLRRVNVSVFVENEGSIKLIKRNGFKLEGKRIKYVRNKATRKYHDVYQYGLFRKDWRKK